MSSNEAAIHLLKQHLDEISWEILGGNEAIFVYDYERMKKNIAPFHEELIARTMHPARLEAWLNAEQSIDDF